jgi:ribonuclease Y
VQRYAASHATNLMTSSVALPNEEMKGRVIGREGRNIRALEAATGVSILIDDTPEAIVISGFDPVRREIARLALEQLITDGRIHPARIEEVVASLQENMEETVRRAGEEAVYAAGLREVDPELIRKIGRLKFRTSYSQNVLQHSMEVANLMGVMAGELNLDVSLAKRIGLFHDIGKALDHEVKGTHVEIGVEICKRYKVRPEVVHCIAAHHEDTPPETPEAFIVAAADALSGARPGARRESLEAYIKRLTELEDVARAFAGVQKVYAISAGREVRVFVDADAVDDLAQVTLAKDIAKKIEASLAYPGVIKVNVIRERRVVETAK